MGLRDETRVDFRSLPRRARMCRWRRAAGGALSSVASLPVPSPASLPGEDLPAWPRSRTDVDKAQKADLVAMAANLDVVVSPAWRAAEIKEVIKNTLFPKKAEHDRTDLRNLYGKKKKELQALAKKIGAHTAPGMTREKLLIKVQRAVIMGETMQLIRKRGGDGMLEEAEIALESELRR